MSTMPRSFPQTPRKSWKQPCEGRGRRRALTQAPEGPLGEGPHHRQDLVVAEAGQSAGAAGFRLAERPEGKRRARGRLIEGRPRRG